MKSVIVPSPGIVEFAEVPMPRMSEYDALVEIEACGICNTTDIKLIYGDMFWAPPFPILLGHESVGRVIEVGSKVTKFSVGDRVTRPVSSFEPQEQMPNAAFGGFSEYGLVRDAAAMAGDGEASWLGNYNVVRQVIVHPELPPLIASLCISMAETAGTLINMAKLRGKTLLVAGTGIAGLGFSFWGALGGARVITLGRREERLELAKSLGASVVVDTRNSDFLEQIGSTAPSGVDAMVDATGDVDLAGKLLSLLSPDGEAVAYGVGSIDEEFPSPWQRAKVEEHRTYHWITELYLKGMIDLNQFVTHTWQFPELLGALEQVKKREVLKGFVMIQQGGGRR
jgi:threonine dehydrogenase-like Zn-dependent dehydrogenase